MTRMPYFTSARAAIIKDNKILMGFEPEHEKGLRGNHWETPGGHIEPMEDVIDGLKREIKEEIGTDVKIKEKLPFFFSYSSEIVDKKYKGNYGIVIFFLCELTGEPDLEKATDKEFNELKFIGKEEFYELVEKNKVMVFDKEFVPKLMEKLNLW